jgi:serine/threonine protein kinase
VIVCPRCQAAFPDEALNYCGRCGADLQQFGSTAPRKAAEAQSHPGNEEPSSPLRRAPDAMIGRVIGARYRILERLGAGGMGVVYQVEHVSMGKIAALKMLHPALVTDREVLRRFQREAQAVSLLTHPNTVQVFDFGESEGSLYMVMEYLRGENLATLLRRSGPLPWPRAASLFVQICDALSEAHDKGLVHRDLKPENVLVSSTRDGRDFAKVLDFGLATLRRRDEQNPSTNGSVVGTPFYMPPEQIRAEEIDARADIYALGALMHRVLTGAYPFEGKTPLMVLSQHLSAPPPLLRAHRPDRAFDPRVEEIVQRCMAKERQSRYPTTDAVRAAIEAVRGSEASPTPSGVTAATAEIARDSEPTLAELARREDFDHFEHSLRRRRLRGLIILPLLAVLVVIPWLLTKRHGPMGSLAEEKEPNNTAATANPITVGVPLRGRLGARLDRERSDRDFYHFTLPPTATPAVLRLTVSGLPNMDLHLGLFGAAGKRLAAANEQGHGGAESLPNQRLGPGDHYIEIREVSIPGRQATENVSDWYTVALGVHPLGADEESEPNDTPDQAISFGLDHPEQTLRGYLGRVGDIDYFRPRGDGSRILGSTVSGIADVDVRLVVLPPDAPGSTEKDPANRRGARVFDTSGPGAPEHFDNLPWPRGAPAPYIVVVRKQPPATDPEVPEAPPHSLPGLDTPYILTVTQRPAP